MEFKEEQSLTDPELHLEIFFLNTKPGEEVGNSSWVTELPYLMPAAVRTSVVYQ